MYFLVLGDFGDVTLIRPFKYDDETELWWYIENMLSVIFFFGATFITQITILNMLISIMSATHAKHSDEEEENSKKQRLLLETEFAYSDKRYSDCAGCCRGCKPFVWLCNCC